jgi:predicted enzyme related to lactoylglutathione lyase
LKTRDPIIIHYVHDMQRAIRFYRDVLGLDLDQESPGWTTLRCGDALVALHILAPRMEEAPLPHAGLNLQVDDLDAAVEEAKTAGAQLRSAIREAGGGVPVRLAELRDPDGNGFELRQFVG